MNQYNKDMHLPIWVCGLGIVFLISAVVLFVLAILKSIFCLVGVVACLGFGCSAILFWKNQWIMMVDDNEFVYSTMFGKKTHYRFSQIKDLKQNADSSTMIFENGKVHIESCAIMSDRFVSAVNSVLEKC